MVNWEVPSIVSPNAVNQKVPHTSLLKKAAESQEARKKT
jgi:hypothetical protein